MNVNGNNITIDIGASAGASVKEINKAISALQKLKQESKSNVNNPLKGFADSVNKATNKILEQQSLWRGIGNAGKSAADKISDSFKNMAGSVKNSIKNAFAGIENAIGGRTLGGLKSMAFSIIQPFAFAAKGVANLSSKLGGVLLKSASAAGRGILSFGKTLITLPFKKAISGVSKFGKKIGTLASSFKRILFYRAIRTIIKKIGDAFREGTQNLYYYSQGIGGQFAASMDMAATSMLYFKNSIGAAVAPIVNALAPVLDMLVDKVVEVINVINQLFAKLTGASSWTRAVKYPKQFGDAVGDAGKAAKEALRYLAPFDELNVLPSDNAGSGSASKAVEDYSSMFEEVSEFNESIADFADKIKEAIEKSDWKGLGILIGEKVNEIVDSIDWSGIGGAIGEKINAWFTTKYWTLKTINFTNIGSKIAELLNAAIEKIDFEVIGRGFTRKFTALFDTVVGFVSTLDWGQVGKSIGDYLRGAFDEASEWLDSYDWSGVGSGLYQSFKNLIEGIDFASLAKSFFKLLGSALGSAVSLLSGIIKDVANDISSYFEKYLKNEDGTKKVGLAWVSGLLSGILDAVKNIGKWAEENILTPFLDGLLGKGAWDAFKQAFAKKWNDFIDSLSGGWLGGGIMDLLGIDPESLKIKLDVTADVKDTVDSRSADKKSLDYKANLNNWDRSSKWKSGGDYWNAIDFKANLSTWDRSRKWKSGGDYWNAIDFKANLNNWDRSSRWKNGGDYWNAINFKANMNDWQNSLKSKPEINVTGKMDKILIPGGGYMETKAEGGVFANGKWNPITAYAGGGSPMGGELFLAREAGPELVGRMGQHTAVMNNDQIVASVSDGVAVANEVVVGALFSAAAQIVSAIREQDNGGGGSSNIDTIARAVTRWQANSARANG